MAYSEEEGYYAVTYLHRQDVVTHLGREKADLLTDVDLARIARKMGEGYVEFGGFWTDLETLVEGILKDKEVKPDES